MKILYLLVAVFLMQCSGIHKTYHGYVYDNQTNMPLNNVFVEENLIQNANSGRSNSIGYFEIENNKESIADLIFSLKGYKKDTVVTVWSQHGESLMYKFLNKKSDTLFLRRVK
ncbi:putative membrane protein [Pedobacter sp. UYP30]|uniref:hypothetical protein n=1 Tax=Pedobacter sp. UYP30 TaxID=1756400 RepID=UPI003392E8CF